MPGSKTPAGLWAPSPTGSTAAFQTGLPILPLDAIRPRPLDPEHLTCLGLGELMRPERFQPAAETPLTHDVKPLRAACHSIFLPSLHSGFAARQSASVQIVMEVTCGWILYPRLWCMHR